MGTHILENSTVEKYFGDKIHKDCTKKQDTNSKDEILKIRNDQRIIRFPTAMGPIGDFKSKIAYKLLKNSDSWIGLNDGHIKTVQDLPLK